jgi:stage II sporulation protein D
MKKKKIGLIIIILAVLLIPIFFMRQSPPIYNQPEIKLYRSEYQKVITLPMEDYITGTVAAEMPASFNDEALKAQAVCARTYAFRKLLEHKPYPQQADLSDDINSCQAFISQEEFYQRHGSKALYQKVQQAVKATRGEIMLYQGEPIDALYHSTCGGKTESAADLWGQDVPYLRSVKCRYCSQSRHYASVQVFSVQELNRSLDTTGSRPIFKITDNTSSGRIKKVLINGKELSGEKLRQLLGLPSTWCGFKVNASRVEIHSRGYGHGLGLCQYGAGGMAEEGKDYHQILKHYYQGVEFSTLNY